MERTMYVWYLMVQDMSKWPPRLVVSFVFRAEGEAPLDVPAAAGGPLHGQKRALEYSLLTVKSPSPSQAR